MPIRSAGFLGMSAEIVGNRIAWGSVLWGFQAHHPKKLETQSSPGRQRFDPAEFWADRPKKLTIESAVSRPRATVWASSRAMTRPALDAIDRLAAEAVATADGLGWRLPTGRVIPRPHGGDGPTDSSGDNDDDGDENDDDDGDQDKDKGSKGSDDGKATGDTTVSMSQADLDKLIETRLAKDRKAREAEAKAEADKAAMSEAEKLKAEKAEADTRAEEAERKALETKVETLAERAAVAADVDPKRAGRFVQLVPITLDDLAPDGEPDEKAIAKLVGKTLDEWPEFKPATSDNGGGKPAKSGGDVNGHKTDPNARAGSLGAAVKSRMGA